MKNATSAALKKVEDGCPPHSAAAAEAAIYESNSKKLIQIGVNIGEPEVHKLDGMETVFYPCIVMSPSFAMTFEDLKVCSGVWYFSDGLILL